MTGEPTGVLMRHGRPLLVYHGTRRRFETFSASWWEPGEEGFFFTPRLAYARRFAGREGRVIAAHLLISNPYEVTGSMWAEGVGLSLGEARAAGHDGYVVRPYCEGTMQIVFDPARIVVLTHDIDRATTGTGKTESRTPDLLPETRIQGLPSWDPCPRTR